MALSYWLKKICLHGARCYATCIGVNDVYVIGATRTPIGCFQGKLSSLGAVELATKALTAAVEKSKIDKNDIQEIIMGCSFQAGLGQGCAHQVALFAGLSNSVISSVVNKQCGSGMKAIMFACQLITSNAQEVVAAGGMESLTNVPFILKRKNLRIGNICVPDSIFHDGLTDRFYQVDVTCFAEETVKEYNYTRQDQDDYALNSYAKAALAQTEKVFEKEIVPIVLKGKKKDEEIEINEDEEVKRLDIEKFRELPPDVKDGTITVGNSAGLHDGAAMVILASGNYVLKKNAKPLAKIVSFADASIDPKKFVLTPSIAIPKALVRANLTQEDIARWEISETFALTAMLNAKILKINTDQLNVHGGAISLGHPFAMTGARLIVHLVHTLEIGEKGCASMCHGPGGGTAMIVEKM